MKARLDVRPLAPREALGSQVVELGLTLSTFLAVTYLLCVGFDLIFPEAAMYPVWSRLLPGFRWLDGWSFLLGLGESFAYGWYIALLYVPLRHWARRLTARRAPEPH